MSASLWLWNLLYKVLAFCFPRLVDPKQQKIIAFLEEERRVLREMLENPDSQATEEPDSDEPR